MHASVHGADVQDGDGGVSVMATLFGLYPVLIKFYVDGGCQGPRFQAGLLPAPRQGLGMQSRKACAFPHLASVRLTIRKRCPSRNDPGWTLRKPAVSKFLNVKPSEVCSNRSICATPKCASRARPTP